jgi:hypothetical protein
MGARRPREATQIGVSSFASGYCVQPQPPPGALPGKPPPSCSRRLCSGTAPRARCLRMGQPWPRTPIYCAPMPERGHNQTSSPAAPAAKSFGPKLARLAKKGPIRSRPPALEWACRSLRWQSAAPQFFSWPPIERGCSAPRQLDSGPIELLATAPGGRQQSTARVPCSSSSMQASRRRATMPMCARD